MIVLLRMKVMKRILPFAPNADMMTQPVVYHPMNLELLVWENPELPLNAGIIISKTIVLTPSTTIPPPKKKSEELS